ncbi:hypothetical protein Amal_03480 [Acetobacter malorum]|uniref:Uncharacterized protein n=1 Tax=Acetobacter malorum TaxID=178901 RepID=A0A177G7J3_9PROT|nr:hypothetical protein Amal_03480 [Acetobacter malorum]
MSLKTLDEKERRDGRNSFDGLRRKGLRGRTDGRCRTGLAIRAKSLQLNDPSPDLKSKTVGIFVDQTEGGLVFHRLRDAALLADTKNQTRGIFRSDVHKRIPAFQTGDEAFGHQSVQRTVNCGRSQRAPVRAVNTPQYVIGRKRKSGVCQNGQYVVSDRRDTV